MKVHCPICKKKVVWEESPYSPFCSERCKLMDLGAWAGEEYRIIGKEPEDERDKKEGRGSKF